MTGCTGMTSLALNLPFLRALSLQACSALTQVGSFQAVVQKPLVLLTHVDASGRCYLCGAGGQRCRCGQL